MRILVCPPDYFAVDYVINPWMASQVGRVDRGEAERQWADLTDDLARFASVEQVAPDPSSPDMCFTANAGLVAKGRVVPARFRMPERQGEEDHFVGWFRAAGFEISALVGDRPFEGEGDALFQPGDPLLWAGHGARSVLDTHAALARTWNVEVVSLRLVDPRFYHLDTCFVPLPEGRVVYFPPAFDAASRRTIEARFAPLDRIEMCEEDALAFACNMLRLEDRLFLNDASEDLRSALGRWGMETRLHPVGEFLKAGGGVKCLTLLLEQDSFESPSRLLPSEEPALRAGLG